jgi:rod shape-determining protein MreD
MSLLPGETPGAADRVRRFAPATTIVLAALVMALPLPLAWGVMPHLALLLVLIWASIQPRLLPAWAAFLLGLFADLLFGMPIGIWALIFPLMVVAVRLAEARVEGHNLWVDWVFASLLILAAHLLAWQAMRFAGQAAALVPMLTQAGLTILAYPLAARLAARAQRRLIDFGN